VLRQLSGQRFGEVKRTVDYALGDGVGFSWEISWDLSERAVDAPRYGGLHTHAVRFWQCGFNGPWTRAQSKLHLDSKLQRQCEMIYSFGDCELNTERYELRRGGLMCALEPKAFDLLLYLVENRERVVTKNEIHETIWNNRIVSEATLSSCVSAARNAVGDSGKQQKLIRTFPRRGFRFIGDVEARQHQSEQNGLASHGNRMLSIADVEMETDLVAAGSRKILELPKNPSVAVVPLEANGQETPEYFVDGLSEDIILGLSRCQDFFVIGRSTSFAYKGKSIDPREIGKQLGVRYVVGGSIRLLEERVRIVAELVDTNDGHQIWSETTNTVFTNSLELQIEIATRIVATVQTQILLNEGLLSTSKSAGNIEHNDVLNRAWQSAYKLSENGLKTAQELATQVVKEDPENPRAHLILAFTNHHLAYLGFATERLDAFKVAVEQGRMAVRLYPQSEYSHWILGSSLSQLKQFEAAVTHLDRAIEINPNFSLAIGSKGTVLAWIGKYEEAIELTEIALRYNPRDPANFLRHFVMALANFGLGKYDVAVKWAERVIADRPRWFLGQLIRVAAKGQLDQFEGAKEALCELLTLRPNLSADIVETLPVGNETLAEELRAGLRAARSD